MLLKIWFLSASPVLQFQIWINSADFTTPNSLILKIEMLLEFQNKMNIEIIGF